MNAENRDRIVQKARDYYNDNKEHVKQNVKGYREANKDGIKEWKHDYYESNKEELAQKSKIYHNTQKDDISAKRNIPYQCICGATPSLRNKARHNKSKVHQAYLLNQTVAVDIQNELNIWKQSRK